MPDPLNKAAVLTGGGVSRTLCNMALPMLAGTFAMTAYNLTDTWFVSRLGTLPLAAMGFTFPVIMLLHCVAAGLGTGVTTLVSYAIGRHDREEAVRVVTHGLSFTLLVAAALAIAGYLTIDPLFARLGADVTVRPLVGEYMRTWYCGAIFMSLPMVGNGILISAGDSKAASHFMILGTVINAVLDPIMIFGWLGFPALGMRGAALATVLAQAIATAWLFQLLGRKHRLFVWPPWQPGHYGATIRRILGFGVPSLLSMSLMPLSSTVITWLLGRHGNAAVAAAGAAGRIEMFAFVVPMALGISLTPFVSQNYGAGRLDRIREALKTSTRFAMLYGIGVALVFFASAPWLAAIFSKDPHVGAILQEYIRIIAFGYGMMEVHRYCGFFLNGLHQPVSATLLNVIRVLLLLIPLSCLGAWRLGVLGIFLGRLATDITAGGIGLAWAYRAARHHVRPEGPCP